MYLERLTVHEATHLLYITDSDFTDIQYVKVDGSGGRTYEIVWSNDSAMLTAS